MVEKEDWMLRFKAFCLIIAIYLFIASIIWVVSNWLIKLFHYQEWGWSDWTLLISILFLIAMYFLYLSPYLEAWLVQRLKNQIANIKGNTWEKRQAEKQAKKEIKKKEIQAKRSSVKEYPPIHTTSESIEELKEKYRSEIRSEQGQLPEA